MMQTLRSPAFKFNESQLCRAYREIYQEKMVIITNFKPQVGEVEVKHFNRLRSIQYFKLLITSLEGERIGVTPHIRLRNMADLRISFQVTNLLNNVPSMIALDSEVLSVAATFSAGGSSQAVGGPAGSLTVMSGNGSGGADLGRPMVATEAAAVADIVRT